VRAAVDLHRQSARETEDGERVTRMHGVFANRRSRAPAGHAIQLHDGVIDPRIAELARHQAPAAVDVARSDALELPFGVIGVVEHERKSLTLVGAADAMPCGHHQIAVDQHA
jgi:hypothetical protein